ncbi:MAG: PIN domain-containing protein [Geminicoccaceae bacterium]|nr:PIN domain-containing protein [Geminicoccaceae bacterium]
MIFLLDTNIIIGLGRADPTITRRLSGHASNDCAVSAISIAELCYGAFRSRDPAGASAAIRLLPFRRLPLDETDAEQAGMIRAALGKTGTPIGPHDCLIAGQARARNLTLVTRNLREFRRIDHLDVEEW